VARPAPAELFVSLAQLRPADADAFLLGDLGTNPDDRPVAPVGHRRFQQRVTVRSAASLFIGVGPGATLAFSAPALLAIGGPCLPG